MKKIALLLALAALIAGCSGGVVRPKIEKGIENALTEYIGPAKEYRVDAGGSEIKMIGGLIKHLHIEGDEVQLAPELTVASMIVDMEKVRYEPSSRKLTSVDSTSFTAAVTEGAVNRFIAKTGGRDGEMSVRLDKDKVVVNFVPSIIGIDILISVTGKPKVVDGDKIDFVADAGSVAHIPAPAYLVNKALDELNPILDMSVMKFPVKLSEVTIKKGSAVIKGNADIRKM